MGREGGDRHEPSPNPWNAKPGLLVARLVILPVEMQSLHLDGQYDKWHSKDRPVVLTVLHRMNSE